MEALHDVVKAGKVRYLGASSMWAWQFAKLQHAADLHGWTRFVSMQDQYNLLQREEEREMFGLLADQGVGSIPWSPLAAGRVARPWGERSTARGATSPTTDPQGRPLFARQRPGHRRRRRSGSPRSGASPMAQVAMAWVLRNPVVDAPIVGATKAHHLDATPSPPSTSSSPTRRSPRSRSTTRRASPPTSDLQAPPGMTTLRTKSSPCRNQHAGWSKAAPAARRVPRRRLIAMHISGYQQSSDDWLAQVASGRMSYHGIGETPPSSSSRASRRPHPRPGRRHDLGHARTWPLDR